MNEYAFFETTIEVKWNVCGMGIITKYIKLELFNILIFNQIH